MTLPGTTWARIEFITPRKRDKIKTDFFILIFFDLGKMEYAMMQK
jgi:hypothetical protein